MILRDLPGFSELFLDYAAENLSARAFLPEPARMGSVRERALELRRAKRPRENLCRLLENQARDFLSGAQTLENIRRLRHPDTVVVLSGHRGGLFGGVLSDLLKCVGAAKIAAALQREGIAAVPVCWLDRRGARGEDALSLSLLDAEGKLLRLSLESPTREMGSEWSERTVPAAVEDLLRELGEAGTGDVQREFLGMLGEIYVPGTPLGVATGRLLSRLMQEWGMVLADPYSPAFHSIAEPLIQPAMAVAQEARALVDRRQMNLREAGYVPPSPADSATRQPAGMLDERNDKPGLSSLQMHEPAEEPGNGDGFWDPLELELVFPAAVHVGDQVDLWRLALAAPLFPLVECSTPLFWPRMSASLLDARSRKALQRYELSLPDLFDGTETVLQRLPLAESIEGVLPRFESLSAELERGMSGLSAWIREDPRSKAAAETTHTRAAYQIDKLKQRFVGAAAQRRTVIRRHIMRLCNHLAPGGSLQESQLSVAHFLMQFSPALLPILFAKLDAEKFEHQLVSVE